LFIQECFCFCALRLGDYGLRVMVIRQGMEANNEIGFVVNRDCDGDLVMVAGAG